MEIIFLSEEEAIQLQTFFYKYGLDEPFTKNKDFFVFSFPEKRCYIDALANFIIHVKKGEFLHKILSEQFYFENQEERDQIIEIVSEMCSGKREELIALTGKMDEFGLIRKAVESFLESSTTVQFDSLLTFRLRDYRETLIRFLHVAIDEYKMEQEYQIFIHMLREYLKDRIPRKKMVHLSMGEEVKFYDEAFRLMEKDKVLSMVDRQLLAIHPIYIDSTVIAPLLSMAPEKILLYTSYDEKPLVRTLINIFEERLIILPPIK